MTTSQQSRLGQSPEESIKEPCVCSTPDNITLAGEQIIATTPNPSPVKSGDRVLVRSQTNNKENGVYIASATAWTRANDFNDVNDVINGQGVSDANLQNRDNSAIYFVQLSDVKYNTGVTEVDFINRDANKYGDSDVELLITPNKIFDKVKGYFNFPNPASLAAFTDVELTTAHIVSGDDTYRSGDYEYDTSNITGIPHASGTGSWIETDPIIYGNTLASMFASKKDIAERSEYALEPDDINTKTIQYDEEIPLSNKYIPITGDTVMKSDKENNILEKRRFSGSKASFSGAINTNIGSFPIPQGRPLRVCILGDSISVGSDFSTERSMPGTARSSGLMLDSTMGLWSDHFVKGLLAKKVPFELYNRSVGGHSLYDLFKVANTLPNNEWLDRDLVDPDATWLENIGLTQPDILIIAHGMNHTLESRNFMENLVNGLIIPGKAAGWLSEDKIVMVSVPNPAWNETASGTRYNEYRYNGRLFLYQLQQRAWCRDNNVPLIDVGGYQTLLRYGESVREKSAFKPNTSFRSIAGAGAGNGANGEITLTQAQSAVYFKTNDVNHEGQVIYNVVLDTAYLNSSDALARFIFMKESMLIISNGKLTIFNGINSVPESIGVSGTGVGLGYKNKLLNYTLTKTDFRLRIDYTEYAIQVFIDDVCAGSMPNPSLGNPWHEVAIRGLFHQVKVTPFKLFSVIYGQYKPVLTSDDIWNEEGGFTPSTNPHGWGKVPYGGGINHPNVVGLGIIYMRPITEFLENLRLLTTVVGTSEKSMEVAIDGSISNEDQGISATKQANTGIYTLYHNTTNTNYILIPISRDIGKIARLHAKNNNNAEVRVYDYDTGILADGGFDVIFKFK